MKNALRAALVVLMGIGSVGCCCHGGCGGCNQGCDDCGGGGCGRSFWLWRPFCCAGCGQRSHLDWWQNPPPCCNSCNQCGQWHGQQYGSGPGGGYYSQGQGGNMPAGAVMDEGDVVDDNGPPQPTPAASQRPVRRTSYVRRRPMQYQNSQQGQYQQQQGQFQQQQGQYQQQQSQYSQQGQNAPQYYQ